MISHVHPHGLSTMVGILTADLVDLHDTHAQHYQGILEKLCAVKTSYLMISLNDLGDSDSNDEDTIDNQNDDDDDDDDDDIHDDVL